MLLVAATSFLLSMADMVCLICRSCGVHEHILKCTRSLGSQNSFEFSDMSNGAVDNPLPSMDDTVALYLAESNCDHPWIVQGHPPSPPTPHVRVSVDARVILTIHG